MPKGAVRGRRRPRRRYFERGEEESKPGSPAPGQGQGHGSTTALSQVPQRSWSSCGVPRVRGGTRGDPTRLRAGDPRGSFKAQLSSVLWTCCSVGELVLGRGSEWDPSRVCEAELGAVGLPAPRPPSPNAAPAGAAPRAAEQVHKNDLIYYRRHVLKQLTKLQDVKRQASAFSFLNPYRLLAMIKIVFSFLKLELIFLSKAIM